MKLVQRNCSMCRGDLGQEVFPFSTHFNNQQFYYRRCTSCRSVIVSPVPSTETFALMYTKDNYHDNHYAGIPLTPYQQSAQLLAKHLEPQAKVLDYGCGSGAFLLCLKACGLQGFGLEFDVDAAQEASEVSGCKVYSMSDLDMGCIDQQFDAIHLGDVLEHMPDPIAVLDNILVRLKPDGILFLEGPLENHASLVYGVAKTFGTLKRLFFPQFIAHGAPTHLIRTHAKAQRQFVFHLQGTFIERHWRVYETGWPYAYGGMVKRMIASLARISSKIASLVGVEMGNRFEALYTVRGKQNGGSP